MTPSPPTLDLEDLELGGGGQVLLARALRRLARGERLSVTGRSPTLGIDVAAFARSSGDEIVAITGSPPAAVVEIARGAAGPAASRSAARAGATHASAADAVVDHPSPRWGLAARGALVDLATPEFSFPLCDKRVVWADEAARLYAQAAAAQWDPAGAIDWTAPAACPDDVEDAVVQIMSYLVENEAAALVVPARFLAQIHPHFREVMQLLAIQTADEARHIEVFTRRATLRRSVLGTSSAGGQASLKTLLDEPDFALAMFLLSVLGEGSFLSLLWFLHTDGPDPVTRQIAKLTAQDEARHVAFGLAHLARHASLDPALRARMANAVERRHGTLAASGGLNEDVHHALVLVAAGSYAPSSIGAGFERVLDLERAMDQGRKQRLERLGFTSGEAEALSQLHTKNFM